MPATDTAADSGSGPMLHVAGGVVTADGLEIAGLALETTADGAMAARIERLVARRVHVQAAASSIDVGSAELQGVVARLARRAKDRAPELVELSAREVRVRGVDLVLGRLPARGEIAPGALALDALDELDGLVRAFITDAMWLVDAEIVVPVEKGAIDFNRVDVEHIGPNSVLAVGPAGVRIEAPHGARIDLLAFEPGAVLVASADARTGDRGRIALRALVDALLHARRGARVADPRLQAPLRRTRVTGELRLGDGALGTARHRIVLTGRAQDRNRVDVSSPALAQSVVVRIPRLAASAATFALPGRSVETTTVSAAVEARIIGTDARRAATIAYRGVHLTISDAIAQDVRLAPTADRADAQAGG